MSSLKCLLAASVALLAATPVHAASNMVPNYEIKLLMDPTKVLDSNFKLLPTVLSTFSMPTSVTKMNVQYLDTNNKDIYNNQWSPRLRKIEGASNFEENYKIRYPISNNDIDAALTKANGDGFDSTSTTYQAQVEWGYQQKTLSISRDKTTSSSGYSGMDLPNQSDSRSKMINDAPDKFNDWLYSNWGTDQLSASRIYGPILAKRSIGTFSNGGNSKQIYIEVWPIKAASGSGTEYIVEASFKVDTQSDATSGSQNLQALLQSKGWFLAQDSLKTSLIMQRY